MYQSFYRMGIYWVIINSLLMAWCGKCQSIEWYMGSKHDISTLLISKETTNMYLIEPEIFNS